MTVLVIRQYSEGYDSVEPLHMSRKFHVLDLCGFSAAKDYLSDIGYAVGDNDAYLVNRAVKFLPNPHYKLKIYLDASIDILDQDDFEKFVEIYGKVHSDLFFCKHPHRLSFHQEVHACYKLSKITKQQYKKLNGENYLRFNRSVLTQNGFHISRHTPETWSWGKDLVAFLEDNEIKRDQICLPIFFDKYPAPKLCLVDWPTFLHVKNHNETILRKLRKKWRFWIRG